MSYRYFNTHFPKKQNKSNDSTAVQCALFEKIVFADQRIGPSQIGSNFKDPDACYIIVCWMVRNHGDISHKFYKHIALNKIKLLKLTKG